MEKEAVCPWCGGETVPRMEILEKEHGKVRERRCGLCGKVLAAYLLEEGDFMNRIRKFQN